MENAATQGELLSAELIQLKERHPTVGDVRSIGLFALIELVKDRATREPLVPFNPPASAMGPMQRLNAFFRERGLYTMVRWNSVFICPPLCISAEQLREGLAIIDEGLERIDAEVRG